MRSTTTIITLLFLLLFLKNINAQNYVYRTNYNGEVEVYKSDNSGATSGSPIGVCRKSYNGDYVYTSNTNITYTPNRNVHQIQYNKEMVPSFYPDFEYLNYSVQKIQTGTKETSAFYSDALKEATKTAEAEQLYLDGLFNRFVNKPKKLMDGWHVVKYFYKSPNNDYQNTYYSVAGFAKVSDNKIIEIMSEGVVNNSYSVNSDISYSSPISQCKALFKEVGENEYREIYFIEGIIDSSNTSLPLLYNIAFAKGISVSRLTIYITDKAIDLSHNNRTEALNKLGLYIDNWVAFTVLSGKNATQLKIKPGSYYLYAVDEENHIWSEQIEVFKDLDTITFNSK